MAGYEIKVPITIKGKGLGKNIGSDIAKQIKDSLKSIGIGGDKKSSESGMGIGKIAGILGSVLAVLSSMFFLIKPIFSLLKVLMMLLWIPLIPIMKPVFKALGEMAKTLAPIMKGVADKVEAAFGTGGFGEAIAVLVHEMVKVFLDMAPAILQTIIGVFTSVAEILPNVLDSLLEGFEDFVNLLIDSGIIDSIINALTLVIEGLIEFIDPLINAFVRVIDALIEGGIVDKLVEAFIKVIDKLIPVIPKLIPAFVKLIEALLPLVPTIADAIVKIIAAVVKSVFESLVNFGRSGGDSKRGQHQSIEQAKQNEFFGDFLMRPGRSAVSFSPDDTIIGVKDASSLGGKSIIVNINNTSVRNDSDIKRMANEVSKVLQRQMTGRFSSA